MTCGGASVQYGVGFGSMLYESYPLDSTTWIASSKDHDYPDMAVVQVYAIGLSSNSYKLNTQIFSSQSSNSENPTTYSLLNNSSPDLQFLVSGGGAQAHWINYWSIFDCFLSSCCEQPVSLESQFKRLH